MFLRNVLYASDEEARENHRPILPEFPRDHLAHCGDDMRRILHPGARLNRDLFDELCHSRWHVVLPLLIGRSASAPCLLSGAVYLGKDLLGQRIG